jgi:hypothetical protein
MERSAYRKFLICKQPSLFHRELLPPARSFYENELGKLGRTSRGWCKALCPFHEDRNPSLSINVDSGAFRCFACGEHGGDILDFLQQRDGVGFKEAAQRLGAWQDAPETVKAHHQHVERERKRERIRLATNRLESAERQLRFSIRSELQSLERIRREMLERLGALHRGVEEDEPDEAGVCWSVLSLVVDEIREAVAAYNIAIFASEAQRCRFVMFPEYRALAIRAVLNRGGLIDDRGKWMEVSFD